jgi:hypothetical protein
MTAPTEAQLRAEPYWDREINTPELLDMERRLCVGRGRKVTAAGGKGNLRHLAGGHRSQEWILRSQWCTNHTYTVQSGLSPEQARHIAAYDDIPGEWGTPANRAAVEAATERLIAEAKAGGLVGVIEILGVENGKLVRWLVVERRYGSAPDSSHRDHVHLTFDRRSMRKAALFVRCSELLLGDEMEKTTILSNERTVNDTLVTTMARIPTDLANVSPALKRIEEALAKVGAIDLDALATKIVDRLGDVSGGATSDEVRAAIRAELDGTEIKVTISGA